MALVLTDKLVCANFSFDIVSLNVSCPGQITMIIENVCAIVLILMTIWGRNLKIYFNALGMIMEALIFEEKEVWMLKELSNIQVVILAQDIEFMVV